MPLWRGSEEVAQRPPALAALAKGTQGEDSAAEALSHRATHLNLQAVIFHAAEYVNGPKVSVVGTCVVLDVALGRLDLSSNGAKLIVKLTEETSEALAAGRLGIGSELCVTGALRKEGRRLFCTRANCAQRRGDS